MAMHLPPEARELTIDPRETAPYPPVGFHFIAEHQFGNGDCWGFYWPIGKEDAAPLVFETYHDNWAVGPIFSSSATFLVASKRAEEAHDDEYDVVSWPGAEEDPRSPMLLYRRARECQETGDLDGAFALLEEALTVLPEFTEARVLYVSHLRRLRRYPEALMSAVIAIRSTPSLGDAEPVAAWLAKQKDFPDLANDPIFENRRELSLKFGGVKINAQYPILLRCIERYESMGQYLAALSLLQTYGELITRETTAFQDRYGFTYEGFSDRYREICAKAGIPDRTLV